LVVVAVHIQILCVTCTATEVDAVHVSVVACNTVKKLMLEFSKLFPSISSLSSAGGCSSSLIDDLSRGLLFTLDNRPYNSCLTNPYASSTVC